MIQNIFGEGQYRDIMRPVFYKIEGVDENDDGRTSFGLPAGATFDDAVARMDELKKKHPEYTLWAVLKFEPFIHVTGIRVEA